MAGIRIRPSEHLLILGKTGSGKTFTTKNVLMKALRKQKNNIIVVLDPKQEYEDLTPNVAFSPKQLNEILYADERPNIEGPDIIRAIVGEPTEAAAEEYLRAAWGPFADIREGTHYKPNFGVRFFIEDMPVFYDSAYQTPPMLKRWVTMGRAPQRTIVATSQRAQLIPKTVITMVDHLFVFRVSEYDGKRVIKEYYGDKASYAVSNIPKFGYVLISDLYEEPIVFDPFRPSVKPKTEEGVEL